MIEQAAQKLTSGWGSIRGNITGTTTATAILISKVQVVKLAALPPNFAVITAAEVAVGQITQTIAACANISLMPRNDK